MEALLASVLVSKNFRVRNVDHFCQSPAYFFPDQQVIPGSIIVRQRGTLFHPGQHVCDFVLDIDLSLSRRLSGQDGTGPHSIRRCTWVCSIL